MKDHLLQRSLPSIEPTNWPICPVLGNGRTLQKNISTEKENPFPDTEQIVFVTIAIP